MVWSFSYFALRNLFTLIWLLARPRRSKELEILVLRHELAMLRRQARQPKRTRADRALLAALSRSVPRAAWAGFSVRPETLLRWHRQLVARRWTHAHRAPGRPPLERWIRTLRADCLDRILILGRRHLEHVLHVYRDHYNVHRPHRALHLLPPNGRDPTSPNAAAADIRRHDLLGGLIHEYEAA